MLTPEEKLLIAVYGEKAFNGKFIRQRRPYCCGQLIDLFNVPSVRFVEIEVEGNKFTLIEPLCPRCGNWVKASYSLIN